MGGWFRKEVKRVGDLKGLKMRVDGLAADMLARLGVAPQQAALAELAQAAEKDGLEAVAGSGAYDDSKLGSTSSPSSITGRAGGRAAASCRSISMTRPGASCPRTTNRWSRPPPVPRTPPPRPAMTRAIPAPWRS